jgi:putative ABC transport system substrate-binding protein
MGAHGGNGLDARFPLSGYSFEPIQCRPLSLGADMRRREFIGLLGGAAVAWPFGAYAQQGKRIRRIGILLVDSPEPMGPFREALADLGYVEGKTIKFETRSARGQDTRLSELAAELVRIPVDVIVAVQTPAAHAAKNATRVTPIVIMAGDPIATGLISNLARPDGNLTGFSATAAETAAKSLELILEMIPGARRVGVLGNADDPFMKPFFDQIRQGAPAVHLEVHEVTVRGNDELNGGFAAISREHADAVVIQGSLPVEQTVELALKYRLPSLSTQKSAVRAGILMAFSASFAERGHILASYVDRILKGAKPADLPVQQPTKYELAINLKTAKAIGLTVPPTLLDRADEVIE